MYSRRHRGPSSSSGSPHRRPTPSLHQSRPRATAGRRCRPTPALLRPADQPRPAPHQALVRDVDDRSRVERHGRPAASETIGPGAGRCRRCGLTSASGTSQIAASSATDVGRRMPRGSVNVSVSALKIRSSTAVRASSPASSIRLFGMLGQRALQRADRLVVVEVDRLPRRAWSLPVVPHAHQRVLKQRQLVLVVAQVIQQPQHQPRRDRRRRQRRPAR